MQPASAAAVRRRTTRAAALLAALLTAAAALAGCGAKDAHVATRPVHDTPSSDAPTVDSAVAMREPGRLSVPAETPDVIVYARDTLSPSVVQRLRKVRGVVDSELFSMGQFFHEEQPITYAAVDPATFRRFTPQGTATYTAVWKRVADGELAIAPALGRRIQDGKGYVTLGNGSDAPKVHVGAYAPLSQSITNPSVHIDAVVNQRWVSRLHMKQDNAVLLSTGSTSPQSIQKQILRITHGTASVQILAVNLDISVPQTAVLTGGTVAAAIGSFTYTVDTAGRVTPQASWVDRMIRTETLPVVGTVRCNKVMLTQLRQVMLEIQREGLSSKIYQYGGCYVPRYIAGTHQLSFHTFGTAIDLNVPDNQRGTAGKMDPRVVAIFEKWGFTWGGTWHYTDPMHFELARLVHAA